MARRILISLTFHICVFAAAAELMAQVTHPLLIAALDSAERVQYGSYRIRAIEKYSYGNDTIFHRGQVAFSRFEHFDGRRGLRYEADLSTKYPHSEQHALHIVFDGRYKYVVYGDSLVQRYDLHRLDPEQYQFHHGYIFFFVPLLMHEPTVRKYYGMRQDFGIPPYQTLGDTLIGQKPCTLIGANWTKTDTSQGRLHYRVLFGIERHSGLPTYFRYRSWEERHAKEEVMPKRQEEVPRDNLSAWFAQEESLPSSYLLEIFVEDYTPTLPPNNFYLDWQGLPKSYEVREFYDCYNRQVIRPRLFEGL
ncbi:MAG: hypothetical protein NZM43_07920 [Saprospiraceae bacterium]|nr:hypothetical protein [Saprospiraceae bacterium]MDW8484234.1 hypothetical protein [Saprospiraceae bacterium]